MKAGHAATFRVLAFGGNRMRLDPGGGAAASVLRLRRSPPRGGVAEVVSVWTDNREEAERIAGDLHGLAFVTTPAPLVRRRVWPWSGATAGTG